MPHHTKSQLFLQYKVQTSPLSTSLSTSPFRCWVILEIFNYTLAALCRNKSLPLHSPSTPLPTPKNHQGIINLAILAFLPLHRPWNPHIHEECGEGWINLHLHLYMQTCNIQSTKYEALQYALIASSLLRTDTEIHMYFYIHPFSLAATFPLPTSTACHSRVTLLHTATLVPPPPASPFFWLPSFCSYQGHGIISETLQYNQSETLRNIVLIDKSCPQSKGEIPETLRVLQG